MRKFGIVCLVLVSLVALNVGQSLACSCIITDDPLEAASNSDAVFSGIVTAITLEGSQFNGTNVVDFDVTGSWKMVQEPTLVLETAVNGALCGYTFVVGVEYFVYANYDAATERYSTHLCTRTRTYANAQDDLDALGAPGVVANDSFNFGALKASYR